MGSELELAAGRQAMFHLPSILIGGLLKLSLETRYANIVVNVIGNNENNENIWREILRTYAQEKEYVRGNC